MIISRIKITDKKVTPIATTAVTIRIRKARLTLPRLKFPLIKKDTTTNNDCN